jgi:hypothetical protein
MGFFSTTGGLVYHWRALRFRKNEWAPFRQKVSTFLDAWNPPEKELLILGPSGGHTLPSDFLERFDQVTLSDPDPLARIVFRRNHFDVKTKWLKEDLIFKDGIYAPTLLQTYLTQHPKTAVLFSNMLGQLGLVHSDLEALKNWFEALKPTLDQHSWASYHDLFSLDAGSNFPREIKGDVTKSLWDWASKRGLPVEIVDHGTSELFSNPPAPEAFVWHLSRRRVHIVGTFSHRRDFASPV